MSEWTCGNTKLRLAQIEDRTEVEASECSSSRVNSSCESCFFPDSVVRVPVAAIASGSMCPCLSARVTRWKSSRCWMMAIWESGTSQDARDGGGWPQVIRDACSVLFNYAALTRSFANKKYGHFCPLLSNFSSSAATSDIL